MSLFSRRPNVSYTLEPWDGAERTLDFRMYSPDTGALGGFYTAEPWGSWSRNAEVWVALPWLLNGDVTIELAVRAYGSNIGRRLLVGLGDTFQALRVGGGEELHRLDFRLSQPARMLEVFGIDVRKRGDTVDGRTLGIGLARLTVRRTGEPGPQAPVRLDLRADSPDVALLHGFNEPEPWGTTGSPSQAVVWGPSGFESDFTA